MPTIPPDPAGDEVVPADRLPMVRAGMLPAPETAPAPRMVHQ